LSAERPLEKQKKKADRRVRKTHQALLEAFSELVQGRRYDEIRVADILADADVGRSTFYEHYRGKDELLVQSMAGIFGVLADAVDEESDPLPLEGILVHFWENRDVARYLFAGPPARDVLPQLARALAERIEERLAARVLRRGGEPALPLRLIATQAAEAQFALITAWLSGRAPCAPGKLAAGLRRSTLGSISALLS